MSSKTVLVVEDSNFIARAIALRIQRDLGHEVVIADSFAVTSELFQNPKFSPFAAIVDLVLPDAEEGQKYNDPFFET